MSSPSAIKPCVDYVDWAPTPVHWIKPALTWAGLGKGDFFAELGCGDGRVLIEAANLGAKGMGIEAHKDWHAKSIAAIREAGVAHQMSVLYEDLFSVNLSQADFVFLFLLPSINEKLKVKFEKELKPGTTVVSREFEIPGWEPGERLEVPGFLFLKWVIKEKEAS